MTPRTQQALELRRRLVDLRREIIAAIVECRQALSRSRLSQSEVVDFAWLTREIGDVADHVRKESEKLNELLDKVACMQWTMACAEDPSTPGRVEGELAVGSPTVGMGANVPSKKSDPEKYAAVMRFLGASQEIIDAGILRPHWPELSELLSARAAQGLPLPPGIPADMTYPRYHLVSLQLKKGVSIGEE